MKRFLMFLSTFFCLIALLKIQARADTMYIDLISQSVQVYGSAYVDGDDNGPISYGFNESGITEVSVYNPIYGDLIATATADVEESTASLYAGLPGFFDSGIASSQITFKANGASYIDFSAMVFRSDGVDDAIIQLFNESTNQLVLEFRPLGMLTVNGEDRSGEALFWWDNGENGSFDNLIVPVNASDIYRLEALAIIGDSEMNEGASVRMELGVPEPATILLLSSGLVGLVGIRKKFKR